MSQDEIVKLLKKKKKDVFTSKEIAELLDIRQETILKSLKKLLKYEEINSRKITKEELEKKGYSSKQFSSRFWVYWFE